MPPPAVGRVLGGRLALLIAEVSGAVRIAVAAVWMPTSERPTVFLRTEGFPPRSVTLYDLAAGTAGATPAIVQSSMRRACARSQAGASAGLPARSRTGGPQ